jgi:hypothetical protein
MKRTVPLFIASITGFVLIAAYFIPYTESWGDKVMTWFDIVAAFAFVLGAGNLLKMHLKKISDRRPGWGYSAVTALAFLITLAVGLAKVGVPPSEKFPAFPWSGSYLHEGGAFWWIYQYVFLPLSATMFAMLAFYIASAAFRAFRAKNVEAIILLTTAFIVLLGRTYAGVVLTDGLPESLSFLRLEQFTEDTIMNVFNLAGTRAIMIGIGLGIVSTSLKVLLGVDRSYLGSE